DALNQTASRGESGVRQRRSDSSRRMNLVSSTCWRMAPSMTNTTPARWRRQSGAVRLLRLVRPRGRRQGGATELARHGCAHADAEALDDRRGGADELIVGLQRGGRQHALAL